MSFEPMKKVNPGDPLNFPASTFNGFVDAANWVRGQQASGGAGVPPITNPDGMLVVYVKNNSGDDVPRFGILGIDEPLILPSANEPEFLNRIMFDCVAPSLGASSGFDHRGKFVITREPIRDGEIGRAVLVGACQVDLDIVDSAHQYAEIIEGDVTKLRSASTGSARILWKDPASSPGLAVVKLGESPSPVQRFIVSASYGAAGSSPGIESGSGLSRIVLCRTWDGHTQGTVDIPVWSVNHNAIGDTLMAIRVNPNYGTFYSPNQIYETDNIGPIEWMEIMDGAIYEMVVTTSIGANYPVCGARPYERFTGTLGAHVAVRVFHAAKMGDIITAVAAVNGYSNGGEFTINFIEVPGEKDESTTDFFPLDEYSADTRTWDRRVNGGSIMIRLYREKPDHTGSFSRFVVIDQHGKIVSFDAEKEVPTGSTTTSYNSSDVHETSDGPILTSSPGHTTSTDSGPVVTSEPPHFTSSPGTHDTSGAAPPPPGSSAPASSPPASSSGSTGCPATCDHCFTNYGAVYHAPFGWDTSYNGSYTVEQTAQCQWDNLGDQSDIIITVYCSGGEWIAEIDRNGFDLVNPLHIFTSPATGSGDCPALHTFTSADGGNFSMV